MSFALEVKDDLLKINNSDSNANRLELEAMLRFGGEIIISRPMKLSFTCNNMGVVRRLVKLCKMFYDIEYDIESRVINRFDNHTVFTCVITNDADKIIRDVNMLGTESDIRQSIIGNEEWMIAYLRGAFLVRGSVNDPMSKNSHLEIITNNENEIMFIQKLMNSFELNARITKRKNYLVAYIKAKDSIGDFLYRIGASQAMNYYENAIITKEIKANAKRAINLDIANQDKTNSAAYEQLKHIQYLEYNYNLEKLDSKILMVMKVRKDHPESSLTQLLDVIHDEYDPNLTKSGLNHRFRKIKELALELAKKKREDI